MKKLIVCVGFVLLSLVPSKAQESSYVLDSNDVNSIDAITAAMYDVISGPAGERNWDRFRSLCIKDAHFIGTGVSQSGKPYVAKMNVDTYIKNAGPMFLKEGFYEVEISRKVERYGSVVHVFSTYESRKEKDAEPFDRGINSIQLLYAKNRWWVVSIVWNSESDDNPIPAKYLK